jgi:hypothetical protein
MAGGSKLVTGMFLLVLVGLVIAGLIAVIVVIGMAVYERLRNK